MDKDENDRQEVSKMDAQGHESADAGTPSVDTGAETPPESLSRDGLSRRGFLKALGVVGAGVTASTRLTSVSSAHSEAKVADGAHYVMPEGFTGTMADLKHVVVLMQENRSFDHYYGELAGVRGFYDKQALQFQNGNSVFLQPDSATSTGYLLPYHDSVQNEGGLSHSFIGGGGPGGASTWDAWVSVKGSSTMRYFNGQDLPFHHALASQFTICDQYHCSIFGPTGSNRYYLMSGTCGPVVNSGGDYTLSQTWQSYPEAMQAAGVTWQVYVNEAGGTASGWIGDYTDNQLWGFAAYKQISAANDLDRTSLRSRAGMVPFPDQYPIQNNSTNSEYALVDFIAACQPGAEYPLPQVSYIVAPYGWCEHPSAEPNNGAHFQNLVIQNLQANPELWKSTLLIINYDENDGFFDHVPAPIPEPNTAGEMYLTTTIGMGARVPMTLVSPWTRGGYVVSELFEHTSVVQFLEQWTTFLGTPALCSNISAWRRSVSGDLLSAIDFAHPNIDPIVLPDPFYPVNNENEPAGPASAVPAAGQRLKSRSLPLHAHATVAEDWVTGLVTATMTYTGNTGTAASLLVYPDADLTWAGTPFTVLEGTPRTYTWDTTQTDGRYAFSIYGPDGFVRSFAGEVNLVAQEGAGVPRIGAELVPGANPVVSLTFYNDGRDEVRYTLIANDYVGGQRSVYVSGGASSTIDWPTENGYYDVIITTNIGNGFGQRYAGRVGTF
jgi:phospholipase C